ncbi:hypothetical protein [Filimonas effusa]|uniref:Outer membrane protein beta-barrel domain-containing protein n=1 Tax=Filimonas effusa TaxID=2508721 RepID=A0A4Q1D5K1_9BACT|nr:hypothetical protein [Filimonas effusa]RXK83790.1 hypothetical protein ESB13_17105 [Filimonas effusa]
MKKFLLFTASAVFITLSASAQISKGSSYLGGGLGFSTDKKTVDRPVSPDDSEQKRTSVAVSPSIGFAYKENRVWGLFLNFAHSSADGYKQNTYGIGGFLRQYKPFGNGFYVFTQESLLLGYTKAGEFAKTYSGAVSFAPGLAYDVSKKFQLELSLNNLVYANYGHSKTTRPAVGSTPESVTKQTNFNIGSSLSNLAEVGNITIGARFVLGR